MIIYLIGSLRNPEVPKIGATLRAHGHDVFDDWYAAGPTADDTWRDYEQSRGRGFVDALAAYSAQHTYAFDYTHVNRADAGVLILPAGKSGHLELGYMLGRGKRGYILLNQEPERFDVMYNFATNVVSTLDELIQCLNSGQ